MPAGYKNTLGSSNIGSYNRCNSPDYTSVYSVLGQIIPGIICPSLYYTPWGYNLGWGGIFWTSPLHTQGVYSVLAQIIPGYIVINNSRYENRLPDDGSYIRNVLISSVLITGQGRSQGGSRGSHGSPLSTLTIVRCS